jgi:RING finger protein 121
MNSSEAVPPAGHPHVHSGSVDPHASHLDPAHAEFMMKHKATRTDFFFFLSLHFDVWFQGHEQLHAALLSGLLLFIVVAQVSLMYWKQRSPKSFELITLAGMLILPPAFALYHLYWRFLIIWSLFAAVTAFFLSKPFLEKPLRVTTPRQVYWFFFLCNKVAFGMALAGYLVLMLDVFMGKKLGLGYFATMLMFYGLFYGVIGRDLASLCADKMAASLGYASSSAMGLPNRELDLGRVCAICCDALDSVSEDSITLPTCGHVFHSFCIRGWRIVGKRECPCCKEKV